MRKLIVAILLLSSTGYVSAQSTEQRAFDGATDGRHCVTFSPLCFIVAYNQFNPGLGFDYEYIFNREAGIGFRLPVALGYEGPEQNSGGLIGNDQYKHTTFYAAPGIRFHVPLGGHRNVEFATGPAILLGNIHFRPYNDYYSGSGPLAEPFNYGLTGFMADNSLNFYRRHFLFGFDARVGSLVELHEGTRFFLHIGMHFGGKF